MPDNEIESRDEKLLILPLGEESKKITQVISNEISDINDLGRTKIYN
jgi:hypothetical protein